MKKKWLTMVMLASVMIFAGCGNKETVEEKDDSSSAAIESDQSDAVTVTSVFGDTDMEITYEKAPERVVSLAGFSTEMLLALGLEDKIVGYAWQDNDVLPQYQEAFEKLTPLCDPGMDPGEEIMLAAQPDLVLSWASWSEDDYYNYENLSKNGIQTYGFHCERYEGASLNDVYEDFLNLGKIFRVEERAEALVGEMQERITAVENRVKEEEPIKVFVCDIASTEEEAFTVGGGLPGELIAKAGGENIIEDTNTNWTHVSWEVVAQANPEWIVIDYYTNADDVEGTIEFLKNHPALKELDAVKNDRFITLGLTDISASERNDDTVELLASYFHPEV